MTSPMMDSGTASRAPIGPRSRAGRGLPSRLLGAARGKALQYAFGGTQSELAMSTSEDSSSLTSLRLANNPNGLDLRRIGAHPDFWYPVAWSDELKPGKVLGRRFAGEPIAIYRGSSGQVFALEDRCAHRQVPLQERVPQASRPRWHGRAIRPARAGRVGG